MDGFMTINELINRLQQAAGQDNNDVFVHVPNMRGDYPILEIISPRYRYDAVNIRLGEVERDGAPKAEVLVPKFGAKGSLGLEPKV
jgi:hypothetical protein